MPLEVGDQIGRIVGAPPGSVGMHQNVTIAAAIVLSRSTSAASGTGSSTPRASSRRCATCSRRRSGTGSRSSSCRTRRRCSTRSTSGRCSSRSATSCSRRRDLGRRSRSCGARTRPARTSFLDAYQSVGAVPLDVTALGVDFATGGSVKWLCGGPGAAWLYVRPDLAERLEPDAHGLAGARAAVRVRAGAAVRAGRAAVPHRHAERARALRGDRRLRRDRGARRRPDPLELAAADDAADPAARRGGPRGRRASATRAGAAARSASARRTSRPCTRSSPSGRSSATSARTSACGSARTTSRPRTSSRFAVGQIAEIVESGAYERHLGAVARF